MMKVLAACLAAVSLLAGAAARAAPIPFKTETDGGGALPGGALGVLLLSLLAIGGVYWVRKRLNLQDGGAAAGSHLKVLETRRMGPRTLLSVVEFGGTQYLLAQTEQGVSCLATAPAKPAQAAESVQTVQAAGAAA